jgi:hypothetical protein
MYTSDKSFLYVKVTGGVHKIPFYDGRVSQSTSLLAHPRFSRRSQNFHDKENRAVF